MIIDRRKDHLMAAHVREALRIQREMGFSPAFALLRSKGLNAVTATDALRGYIDRRQKNSPAIEPAE